MTLKGVAGPDNRYLMTSNVATASRFALKAISGYLEGKLALFNLINEPFTTIGQFNTGEVRL